MKGVRPADYPPPWSDAEAIGPPTDAPDERIDVGILIVGGGPGGLACAVRLGQLLEEHPDVRERLGDVPVAVLEKGKQAGSHLLSGAVMNPRAIRKLFSGRLAVEDMPTYGQVEHEAVYLLTKGAALRIPPPPTMMNRGNWVVSVSELGRFLAEQAEAGGAMILPETAGQTLLVEHGRVAGVRTGDKGRGRDGEPLPNFEPGADVTARITVLAEGTAGHLTTAAIDHFGLHGRNPQIWALGVKEVWKVSKPLRKVVHTMGWPLRKRARYGEFGGSWIYPMGDEHVSLGFVVGLEYADVELSAHDLRPGVQDAPARPEDPRTAASASPGARRRSRRAVSTPSRRGSTPRACCSSARAPGSSTCRGSRACTTRSSRGGSRPRLRSRRCSAARSRDGEARSTATTRHSARATSGRTSPRSGTCARPSTRDSSWAARSRAR